MSKKQKDCKHMRYVSFASHKSLLDQRLRTETQILEDGVWGRCIGLSGKWPRNVCVCVKLD